ncbi:hypothetical protein NG796_00035 [Laspinema sp. A4]|uniref:hypothetical protein n=1 Tax=Laspinema sp. D2d TaxID=2953686 RepID=UPI0021BAAFEE|nr:hypothetical protein [Laspinema sp. D2d]MCT7981672.1 hypothetical protein [Laspinema sp. D2d]
MQPLDPAGCSNASPNQSIPYSARDKLAESILNAAKNSSKTTQAALFVLPHQLQGDRRDATDLSVISIPHFHKATCRP